MINKKVIEESIVNILKAIGEDPDRAGLKETPKRVANAMAEVFAGYEIKEKNLWNVKVFTNEVDGLVEIKDIPTYSMCEPHLLPMLGTTTVRYKTRNKTVIGLSKVPRLVADVSHRLQLQERMTQEIADRLYELIQPEWVEVEQDLRHMCCAMRGAKADITTHSYAKVGNKE